MQKGLNRNQIKYIVIVAMLIDHIAWAWVPTASALGQAMHFVGRLTGATMAYFVAEGYVHTRDVKKYALRLAAFALISWPAFCLFEFGVPPIRLMNGRMAGAGVWCFYLAARDMTLVIYPVFGVIYTLLLSLLAVWLWDSRLPLPPRLAGIAALIYLSRFGDWQYFDVVWALIFFIFRDRPKLKWALFCVSAAFVYLFFVSWNSFLWSGFFQLGVYLVPPLLALYNGQSGSRKPVHKWFFYVFYPAHLLLLAWLRFGF